jgi:hypothetical protein
VPFAVPACESTPEIDRVFTCVRDLLELPEP